MQRALSGSRTGPRKQPPHQVEVEAAEQSISRICHKICLPNDTSEVSPCPRDPAAPVPGSQPRVMSPTLVI